MSTRPKDMRLLRILGAIIGIVLAIIGVRFLLWPESAQWTFGVGSRPVRHEWHHVIALRDIWLGVMGAAFALLREWRALAIWLGLATLVCFGDAFIVWGAGGRIEHLAFHSASGVLCGVLGWMAWKASQSSVH